MHNNQPISFMAYLTPVDGPMVNHVIIVPQDVSTLFRQPKGAVRVLCSVEGQAEFPCALNPRGADYVIIASKQLIRQHRLKHGVPFRVAIRKDEHNGLLMPEELAEVLCDDAHASQLFEDLAPGHKRGLIYYVRSAKSIDTRIKRSFELAEKLKSGKLHVQSGKE